MKLNETKNRQGNNCSKYQGNRDGDYDLKLVTWVESIEESKRLQRLCCLPKQHSTVCGMTSLARAGFDRFAFQLPEDEKDE